MIISKVKGLFGQSADIFMKEIIQGEQYAQFVNIVDEEGDPIDISQWIITARYRKATARIKIQNGTPSIDRITLSDVEEDSGTLDVTKQSDTGVYYVMVPANFSEEELEWDNTDTALCALVEIEYMDPAAIPQPTVQKHRLWFVIRPSLGSS